jgi:hypothetical protein
VTPSRSKNVVFEWFAASSILAWSSARVGYVDLTSDGRGGYNIELLQQAIHRLIDTTPLITGVGVL